MKARQKGAETPGAGHALPRKARQRRRCLCCGDAFMSAGPMNRLCSRCRAKSVTELELWGGA